MPLARVKDAEIHYEVVGDGGPWVVLLARGREPLDDSMTLARLTADRGCRVLVHDRRNCGRSSLALESVAPEEEMWADDLAALQLLLGVSPAVLCGWSRGARVAVKMALRHPDSTRALVLWGLSGGRSAVRFLDNYYFGVPTRAVREKGMDAVRNTEAFTRMLQVDPSKEATLRSIAASQFILWLEGQRHAFLTNSDRPVMGLTDSELQRVRQPTVLVPYYDLMHPHDTLMHALAQLPDGRLHDIDPARWGRGTTHLPEDQATRDQLVVAQVISELAMA